MGYERGWQLEVAVRDHWQKWLDDETDRQSRLLDADAREIEADTLSERLSHRRVEASR